MNMKRVSFPRLIYRMLRKSIWRRNSFSVEMNYLSRSEVLSKLSLDSAMSIEFPAIDERFVGLSATFAKREMFVLKNCILDTESGRVFLRRDSKHFAYAEFSSEWPKENVISEIEFPKRDKIQWMSRASVGLPKINYYHLTTHWLGNAIELSSRSHPIILSPYSHSLAEQIVESHSLNFLKAQTRWIEVDELSMINLGPIGYLHPTDRDKILQDRPNKNQGNNTKRLYVSRRRSSRSLQNEKKIEELLSAVGFDIIYAENLKYSQQVSIFSNARIIVGPHGAGMTNAIYAPAGAIILEVMPDFRINRCIEWQSLVCNQKYARIIYSKSEPSDVLCERILVEIDKYE